MGKLVVETWGETPRNRKTAMFFQMWFPKNTFLGKVDSSRQPSMPMLDDRWTSQDFIIKHQNFPSNLDAWICSRYFEATAATSDHFAIHFAIPLLFGTCQSSNAKWLRRSRARLQHPPGTTAPKDGKKCAEFHRISTPQWIFHGFSMVDFPETGGFSRNVGVTWHSPSSPSSIQKALRQGTSCSVKNSDLRKSHRDGVVQWSNTWGWSNGKKTA